RSEARLRGPASPPAPPASPVHRSALPLAQWTSPPPRTASLRSGTPSPLADSALPLSRSGLPLGISVSPVSGRVSPLADSASPISGTANTDGRFGVAAERIGGPDVLFCVTDVPVRLGAERALP